MPAHPIVHVEIATTDLASSTEFYSELFGWEIQRYPEMDYALFAAEGGPGGGFPTVDGQMTHVGDIKIYVATDDIDATLAKANQLGATTLVGKTEIPGFGHFAFFRDPCGTPIGLFSM